MGAWGLQPEAGWPTQGRGMGLETLPRWGGPSRPHRTLHLPRQVRPTQGKMMCLQWLKRGVWGRAVGGEAPRLGPPCFPTLPSKGMADPAACLLPVAKR